MKHSEQQVMCDEQRAKGRSASNYMRRFKRSLWLLALCFSPFTFHFSLFSSSAAQDLGAKLPLVTAGTSLGWMPSGDEVEFTLPEKAWIKLSIYSPTLDLREVGDELYAGDLASTFRFSDDAGTIREESFYLAPSNWVSFYEGALDAGRYVLRSDALGKGKNIYLLKLETSLPDIPLQGYSTTVNASSFDWQDAFSFELIQNAPCVLELYDGDGATELEARMIQPTGYIQPMTVSEDLATISQNLPRLMGVYTVQLRMMPGTYQKTNSVRFALVCAGEPQLVTLVPPIFVEAQNNPIVVEVIDTLGNPLAIPYSMSSGYERDVSLEDHPEYRLVEVQTDGGNHVAERMVRFGPEGGRVTYILERIIQEVTLPLPQPQVQLLPAQPLPLPEAELVLPQTSKLTLSREFSHTDLLPCQTLVVTLRVQNDGTAPGTYVLREMVPQGFALHDHGGAMVEESGLLTWQGEVAAGAEVIHSYTLEVVSPQALEAPFQARLDSDDVLYSEAKVLVYNTSATLTRLSPQGSIYVGDEVEYQLSISNPLSHDLELQLSSVSARLTLLDLPTSIRVPAASSSTTIFKSRLDEAGVAVLQLNVFACDPAGLVSGNAAIWREEALALPELPQPYQSTTVTVDMAAYQLPIIDGLVLVQRLPKHVSYVSASTRINTLNADDPMQALTEQGSYLVFELPDSSIATLSFTVLHQESYKADLSDSTLIVLSPKPEVLIGDAEALRYYTEAMPIEVQVAARARTGSLILTPASGTVIREGSSIAVTVDTPLESHIRLLVNDQEIPEGNIATKTLDSGINRQTFEYLGLALQEGHNTIVLESTEPDGRLVTDSIEVFVAGVPSLVTLTPLTPLVARSASPLEFEVRVEDAWGNAPRDSSITLEIVGAEPVLRDANPGLVGYQIDFVNGRGLLKLEPVTEARTITIRALIGKELGNYSFAIESDLRPWIVNGYASGGVHYNPGSGDFKFGVGASFFAKGKVFDDYLLTLAANYPLNPLGSFNANTSRLFETFPVTGSSGTVSQEAYSQFGVYARLERNLSFVQLGDFNTSLEGYLLALSRAYTGLSFQYQPSEEGLALRGYASYARPTDRITDLYIPSDGTREYILPDKKIKLDTLQLEVLKGDCKIPRDFVSDTDPLLGYLKPGVDYVVDREGIVRLNNRLPLTDAAGNCYYLRANYQLEPDANAARAWQYGAQAAYRFGIATVRAGIYQENLLNDAYARVIAAGLSLQDKGLKADLEIAYGQNQESSGIAATLQLGYQHEQLSANASYRFFADGYRSAVITDARSSGHDLKLGVGYALTPNLILSADTQWRQYTEDNTSQLQSSFLATYKMASDVRAGETLLGRNPALQFGVQYDKPRSGDAGFRLISGASINDVFGLSGSQLSITHRQGLASTSITDFSVSYRLFQNLTLRLTDRVVWGNSNSLLVGLESSFSNCDVLPLAWCESVDLGKTKATAQYELTGGVSGQAGRILLGVDTEIPVTDELTLNGGISQKLDFSDSKKNETVLSVGAVYDQPELVRAEVAYDLRFAVDVKHVLFASSTFAINERAFGNVTVDYLRDPSVAPKYGLKFALAGAYRGERLSMLSSSALRLGQFAKGEQAEFGGDTRLNFAIDSTWSLRSGYLFDYQETFGYRDLTSVGLAASLWSGGNLSAYGRIYHDWSDALWRVGGTLEASQSLGCGLYGVIGYNLLDGIGANEAAIFGETGVFLRIDIVFDEEWRCGKGQISGRIFYDANRDGLGSEGEKGLSGVRVILSDSAGHIVNTTYSDTYGEYTLTVPVGDYRLHIETPGTYKATTEDIFQLQLGFGETYLVPGVGFFK